MVYIYVMLVTGYSLYPTFSVDLCHFLGRVQVIELVSILTYYDLLIFHNKSTLRGSKWVPCFSEALDRLVSYKILFRENPILFRGLGLAWEIKVLRTHILPIYYLDLQDSAVGSNFYILAQGEPDSQIPSFLPTPLKVL